jgi:hypothetical protein
MRGVSVRGERLVSKSELAKAIRYALARMGRLRPYLDHGCLEAENNCAERAMKPVALGRKSFLFVGSEDGGKSAAIACTPVETAKLNGVDPLGWLTHVLGRMPSTSSPGSTSCCPGVTLPSQRNGRDAHRARAA